MKALIRTNLIAAITAFCLVALAHAGGGAKLTAVSVSPNKVAGGTSAVGTVSLQSAATGNGVQVSLSAPLGSGVTVPAAVKVSSGLKVATFSVTTAPLNVTRTVTITAKLGSTSKTTTLTLTPTRRVPTETSGDLDPGGDIGQDIVLNGSFETGDFSGWTLAADPNSTFVDSGFSSDGAYAAWLGEPGGNGTLSQILTTVPGALYRVSFDFAGYGDDPSFFSASFGQTTLLSVLNPPFDENYVTQSFDVRAASSVTPLVFTFRDDLVFLNLDNVHVVRLQ